MSLDDGTKRLNNFREIEIVMDGRDVITTTLNQQSILQSAIEEKDKSLVQIYLDYMFEHNVVTKNKYSQMMRILPVMIYHQFNLSTYFRFFNDSFLSAKEQDSNEPQFKDIMLEDNIEFELRYSNNPVHFNQVLPTNMQDETGGYTDDPLQIFPLNSNRNPIALV